MPRGNAGYVLVGHGAEADPDYVPGVTSVAPEGMYRVTNIYVDSATGKLVVEYEVP